MRVRDALFRSPSPPARPRLPLRARDRAATALRRAARLLHSGFDDDAAVAAAVDTVIRRTVVNPDLVRAEVDRGLVVLHGHVPAPEREPLLDRLAGVRGVVGIDYRCRCDDHSAGDAGRTADAAAS